jgi:hypothetical protein
MITRFSGRRRLGRVGLALGILSFSVLVTACTKVPLLAPTGSSITLTAAATTLPVNGSTDLIAQVLEAGGTPPQNHTLVTFTTNLGTVQPSQAETFGGRVTVKFFAGSTSGEAKIVATSGGAGGTTTTTGKGDTATTGSTNAVTIKIGGAAVETVSLTASAASVSPNGGSVTLTATANDVSGNRLPGVPITFTTTAGSLSASVVNTDENGNAVTTLTTSRAADVTATAGKSTQKLSIGVNTGPSISLSGPAPPNPTAGQPVTFTVTVAVPGTTTGTPAGAAVRTVTVDFGDGSPVQSIGTAPSTSVTHTYFNPGTYTVTGTATDANGERSQATSGVSVLPKQPLTVSMTTSPNPAKANAPVTFTATPPMTMPSGVFVDHYEWSFGDGASRSTSSSSTSHVYTVPGTYVAQVTLVASDGSRANAVVEQKIDP